MRKVIVVVPGWLAPDDGDSVLRQNLPALARMAEAGELAKIAPLPPVETPEALLLGIEPDRVRLAQGPLTVAALGADPPERSTHFHLSILSLNDQEVTQHKLDLPPEEVDLVLARAAKLNTKTLTVVPGEGVDHGLVWEALGDLGTTTPTDAEGKPMRESLPQGDNEPALRRFIDDSVNLLGELEFNEKRIDEGLQPINLLWPWGQGVRTAVPNLALRRGEPARVLSDSLRLAGLTRLAGYRHGDRRLFGAGINVRLDELRSIALQGPSTLIVLNAMARFEKERIDEKAWLTNELDEKLFTKLVRDETPTRIAILAPAADGAGLGLTWETGNPGIGSIPFDERALEERLPTRDLATWIDQAMNP